MPRLDHLSVPGMDTVFSLTLGELPDESECRCPSANRAIRRKMLREAFQHYRTEWMGGLRGWDEAGAILENGWPEGAERLRALARTLAAQVPQGKSIRRRLVWADDGDEICRDRLQSGQLEQCWRTMRRVPWAAPQTVAIETEWGGRFRQTAEELFWQGAAAAVLTDVLEEAGYRAEVYANRIIRWNGRYHWVRVKVKEADKPMRLDGVAAVLCHAGIFRTFGFLCIEQAEFSIGDWSHGACTELRPEDALALNGGIESIHIGLVHSEHQALEVIGNFLEQKGAEQSDNPPRKHSVSKPCILRPKLRCAISKPTTSRQAPTRWHPA